MYNSTVIDSSLVVVITLPLVGIVGACIVLMIFILLDICWFGVLMRCCIGCLEFGRILWFCIRRSSNAMEQYPVISVPTVDFMGKNFVIFYV